MNPRQLYVVPPTRRRNADGPVRADDLNGSAESWRGLRVGEEVGEKENPGEQVCNGTIVSRQQYLKDIHEWGYEDARLVDGVMSEEDIELWTAGIAVDGAK